MRIFPKSLGFALILLTVLSPVSESRGVQFLEIKVQIEVNDWDFWLLRDRRHHVGQDSDYISKTIFPSNETVRCVLGTNTWLIEGEFLRNAQVTEWFTGTNIIEHTVITSAELDAESKRLMESSGIKLSPAAVGSTRTRTCESNDGNPGRPVRVADLLFEETDRIAWLAFCSGSVLKQEERLISPPSSLWKETRLGFSYPFLDKVSVFQDDLGLPKSLTLYATNGLPVLEYQVSQSTNVLGWHIPLEFYLIQYVAHGTNEWSVQMTAKGKVTFVGTAPNPGIPIELK